MHLTGIIGLLVVALVLIGCGVAYLQHRRARARERYEHLLEDALADGVMTEAEAEELAGIRKGSDLADAEVRMVALSIYRRALQEAASDARITAEEDTRLRHLQDQLALSDKDLEADRQQVHRVRLLARIERGQLPQISAPIALDPGEVCHWAVQCRIAQRLSIPGAPKTPASSLRFRVDSNTPFYASGEREFLQDRDDVLPLDLGMLLVTNRRTLFRGARKLIAIPHARLTVVDLYRDALRLEELDNGASHLFLVDDSELTAAMLLTAARQRRTEVRGAPGRTA